MSRDFITFESAAALEPATLEEGSILAPDFGPDGLIPAIAADFDTGDVLMMAWMNAEALARSLECGEAWYWSRRRKSLWHKGATSGQVQKIMEIRIDCDQDTILLRVRPQKPGACHVGYPSCFFRSVKRAEDGSFRLEFVEQRLMKR